MSEEMKEVAKILVEIKDTLNAMSNNMFNQLSAIRNALQAISAKIK